jgi:hypothetical protein
LYGQFDRIAARHKVFKVETVSQLLAWHQFLGFFFSLARLASIGFSLSCWHAFFNNRLGIAILLLQAFQSDKKTMPLEWQSLREIV